MFLNTHFWKCKDCRALHLPEIDHTDNFTEENSISYLHTRLKVFIQNAYENMSDQLWWNTVKFTDQNNSVDLFHLPTLIHNSFIH